VTGRSNAAETVEFNINKQDRITTIGEPVLFCVLPFVSNGAD
tara:strand:- start:94 stop:219 length:126 start_codon:yes stop_codon:yes gene_type:complete